jgi:hypothetical protein
MFYNGLSLSIYFRIFTDVFFVLFQSFCRLVAFYDALILGFSTQVFYGALFDRIVAKGKSKKLALLAVCNKLLKQAFARVKSGVK